MTTLSEVTVLNMHSRVACVSEMVQNLLCDKLRCTISEFVLITTTLYSFRKTVQQHISNLQSVNVSFL